MNPLTLLCCLLLSFSPCLNAQSIGVVTVIPASLGKTYQNQTSAFSELHYVYKLESGKYPPRSVRVRTRRIRGGDSSQPVRINVRQDMGTLNWHLPFEKAGVEYDSAERSLCILEESSASLEIKVIVSTSNQRPISFELEMFDTDEFTVNINNAYRIRDLEYSTPDFRYVDLSRVKEDSLLEIKVTSDEEVCAIVSVQHSNCPVSDTEETVRAEGAFQTMLELSAFSINRKNWEKGAFIVFLISADDSICGLESTSKRKRVKSFKYEITDTLSKTKLGLEVGLTTGLLVAITVITVVATLVYSVFASTKDFEKKMQKLKVVAESQSSKNSAEIQMEEANPTANQNDDSYGAVADMGRMPNFVSELATKTYLTLAANRDSHFYRSLFHKNDLYVWLVLMMGVFYGIPAVQLVMSYQKKFFQSGDQDLCFYNFLCAIPTSSVKDFNHIYSNIWYLGFGVLFLFLAWYRKRQHLKFVTMWNSFYEEEGERFQSTSYGLPQHFGVFYAMGYALVFEGILSACYHVCPTPENFQFDTTFMYVISSLTFIKIYQFRHPDVTSSAYKVFFGLGLIMFIEVLGIFYETTAFWVLCLLGYFIVSCLLSGIIYHSGLWSFDFLLFKKIYNSAQSTWRKKKCESKQSTRTLVLSILLNMLNITFVMLGAVLTPDISSFILGVFICNLMLYTIYYFSMKLIHKERITLQAYLYLIFSLLCWATAIYFYVNADYSTLLSPAQSRNLNADCILLDLFDHHDIWHILSAGGLFFCFMLLLTLDDGLFYVPRNTIRIF